MRMWHPPKNHSHTRGYPILPDVPAFLEHHKGEVFTWNPSKECDNPGTLHLWWTKGHGQTLCSAPGASPCAAIATGYVLVRNPSSALSYKVLRGKTSRIYFFPLFRNNRPRAIEYYGSYAKLHKLFDNHMWLMPQIYLPWERWNFRLCMFLPTSRFYCSRQMQRKKVCFCYLSLQHQHLLGSLSWIT